jgi:hypothetical protein
VTLTNMTASDDAYVIERPATFRPDTPIGITWPGAASVRLVWLGEQ